MRTICALAVTTAVFVAGPVLTGPTPADAAPKAKAGQASQTKATAGRSARKATQRRSRTAARRAAPVRRATPPVQEQEEEGYIIRGTDNIALVAMLPWWRADDEHTIRYLDRAVVSQVLTSADSWVDPDFYTVPDEERATARAVVEPPAETVGSVALADTSRMTAAAPIRGTVATDGDALTSQAGASQNQKPQEAKPKEAAPEATSWLRSLLAWFGIKFAASALSL